LSALVAKNRSRAKSKSKKKSETVLFAMPAGRPMGGAPTGHSGERPGCDTGGLPVVSVATHNLLIDNRPRSPRGGKLENRAALK